MLTIYWPNTWWYLWSHIFIGGHLVIFCGHRYLLYTAFISILHGQYHIREGGGEGRVIRGYYIYIFYIIFSIISTASMDTVEDITGRWKTLGCNQICKLIRIFSSSSLICEGLWEKSAKNIWTYCQKNQDEPWISNQISSHTTQQPRICQESP